MASSSLSLKVKFYSHNVRGIRDYRKRRKIFNWFAKHEGKIVFVSYRRHIVIKVQKIAGVLSGVVPHILHMAARIVVV